MQVPGMLWLHPNGLSLPPSLVAQSPGARLTGGWIQSCPGWNAFQGTSEVPPASFGELSVWKRREEKVWLIIITVLSSANPLGLANQG